MFLERKNIRKVAMGSALVGAVCLMLSGLPPAVQMLMDLFFLIVVLFINMLQDRRFMQQTLAAQAE